MMRVEYWKAQVRNEVKEFEDLQSFGAAEACWRIFEFEMSDRYPSVKRLPVHLQNQQPVFIFEYTSLPEALEYATATELTQFFNYNDKHPETNTPYIKFPQTFIYDKKEWRIRKQGSHTIGRVYSIHPSNGEVLLTDAFMWYYVKS